jgi:hypothetical protein
VLAGDLSVERPLLPANTNHLWSSDLKRKSEAHTLICEMDYEIQYTLGNEYALRQLNGHSLFAVSCVRWINMSKCAT